MCGVCAGKTKHRKSLASVVVTSPKLTLMATLVDSSCRSYMYGGIFLPRDS